MTTPHATIDKARQELDLNTKRMEAAFDYWLKPETPRVGMSPKEVVWTKNKSKLYRYFATTERKHATPIFMVYALINKPYILDLTPGNSLIEHLVSQGYDVFLLDWGTFGEEDQDLTLDELVCEYIHRAAKQVMKVSGQPQFTLFGYCMGGTMSLMYAASHPEMPIKNLVLLTTPVDFADSGLFGRWTDEKNFDVDHIVDSLGNIPPEFIRTGSMLLKPMQNYYGTFVQLWDKIHDRDYVKSWMLLDHWVNDGIPFPGAAYRQWIKHLYQNNDLFHGKLHVGGRKVDLSSINCSVLVAIAEADHIVQRCQATALTGLVETTDIEVYSAKAGHVGIVSASSAKKQFYPKLVDWLSTRS